VPRSISAQEARQRLGELLEEVFYRGDEVVIERAGKPMGVVVSPQRYAAYERQREEARKRFWEKVDKVWEQNKDVDPDEVDALVAAEIEASRREEQDVLQPSVRSEDVAETVV
jgi:prevent-host-death family protein